MLFPFRFREPDPWSVDHHSCFLSKRIDNSLQVDQEIVSIIFFRQPVNGARLALFRFISVSKFRYLLRMVHWRVFLFVQLLRLTWRVWSTVAHAPTDRPWFILFKFTDALYNPAQFTNALFQMKPQVPQTSNFSCYNIFPASYRHLLRC